MMARKSNNLQGPNTTGSALLSYLKRNGVSQRELSRRTGLDVDTVQRVCHGDGIGTMGTWMRIWKALNATPNDVLGYSDNPSDGLQ